MLEWYKDKNIGIYFDRKPFVVNRYQTPEMSAREKKSILKFPFANMRRLEVWLIDYSKPARYAFTIPEEYYWDGASIPRAFWRLIGPKTDPRFLIPSLIHDQLCENKHYVKDDRYFADKVFERLLYVSGVPAFNRWLMFHSVDNYQKFCGWKK